jgi:hypothetical protein
VAFQKGLRRFGWERHYEAIIGMRKVYGQIVRLALHPGNDYQRLAEIRLCFARRMHQRHKHLLAAQRRRAHIILHDRVAAAKPMLFF